MVFSSHTTLALSEAAASPPSCPRPSAHRKCSIVSVNRSQSPHDLFQPHQHACWELAWIAEGDAIFCTNAGRLKVSPGTLLLVNAGQQHWWLPPARFSGFIISFSADLLELESPLSSGWARFHVLSSATSSIAIEIPLERQGGVHDLCTRMAAEGDDLQPFRDTVLRACLELILIEGGRHVPTAKAAAAALPARIAGDFLNLVELHYKSKHRTQEYADLLHHSVYALSQHVWSQTGKTPACLIRERRLAEARRLLAHSELSVSEIAYALGFKTPSNFGRFFRKYTGQTPGDTRLNPSPPTGSIQNMDRRI